MFLNNETIENTFVREGFGPNGERESILVVTMNDTPENLKKKNPKNYQTLNDNLSYLDDLAQNGFLDFNRIEVVSNETLH